MACSPPGDVGGLTPTTAGGMRQFGAMRSYVSPRVLWEDVAALAGDLRALLCTLTQLRAAALK
eukprot:12241542-Prorocentrum_lima.AAC.1